MPSAAPLTHNTHPGDDFDDILHHADSNNAAANEKSPAAPQNPAVDANTLGIDEEVKIVKQRRPIPKLDENLLLSNAGISKLRKTSKERLRFKGKGHEYGDIARMLNMYQLWLDDLYPRAKFADGLAIIEKLGHTKRVQYMRKEWIDEGKPKTSMSEDELRDEGGDVAPRPAEPVVEQMEEMDVTVTTGPPETRENGDGESQREVEMADHPPMNEEPDDDELDALLAESEATSRPALAQAPRQAQPSLPEDDMFADDLEAMAEMEDMW